MTEVTIIDHLSSIFLLQLRNWNDKLPTMFCKGNQFSVIGFALDNLRVYKWMTVLYTNIQCPYVS